MGIILGALGGLGEGLQNQAKAWHDEDMLSRQFAQNKELAQFKAQIEQQAQEHLIQLKANTELATANTAREQQVARLAEAKKGVLNEAIVKKANDAVDYTDPETGESSPIKSVDEIPDEDLPNYQLSDKELAVLDANREAARRTGDLSPKDDALLNTKEEATAMRGQVAQVQAEARISAMQTKMETMMAMNAQTNATRSEIAALNREIAREKIAARDARDAKKSDKIDTATGRWMISSLNKDMDIAQKDKKAIMDQMSIAKSSDKAALQSKLDDIDGNIKEIQEQKRAFFVGMGYAPDGNPPESAKNAPARKPDLTAPAKQPEKAIRPKNDPLNLFGK